nr:hypothetical protein Itr_chr01CG00480 [Ipomoea trifida]
MPIVHSRHIPRARRKQRRLEEPVPALLLLAEEVTIRKKIIGGRGMSKAIGHEPATAAITLRRRDYTNAARCSLLLTPFMEFALALLCRAKENRGGRGDESLPSLPLQVAAALASSPVAGKQGRPLVQAGLLPSEFTTAVHAATDGRRSSVELVRHLAPPEGERGPCRRRPHLCCMPIVHSRHIPRARRKQRRLEEPVPALLLLAEEVTIRKKIIGGRGMSKAIGHEPATAAITLRRRDYTNAARCSLLLTPFMEFALALLCRAKENRGGRGDESLPSLPLQVAAALASSPVAGKQGRPLVQAGLLPSEFTTAVHAAVDKDEGG